MRVICDCGAKTLAPKPLKYSPDDHLAGYRRKAKIEEYRKRGLL